MIGHQQSEGVLGYCDILNSYFLIVLFTHDMLMEVNIAITLAPFLCLLVFLYAQCLHIKCKIFWKWALLFLNFPLHFHTSKPARQTTSQKFSWGSSWPQGGEQSIGTSAFSSARTNSASCSCLPKPTYIVLYTFPLLFLQFLFINKCPFYVLPFQ